LLEFLICFALLKVTFEVIKPSDTLAFREELSAWKKARLAEKFFYTGPKNRFRQADVDFVVCIEH